MITKTSAPAVNVADIDIPAFFMKWRAAMLMQVRWVEDHIPIDDPRATYFAMMRRSQLEIVREIEHELGIKPKKRKVLRRRL